MGRIIRKSFTRKSALCILECEDTKILTNRSFAEFLFGDLIGQVSAHQDVALYPQILFDDLGDQFDTVSFATTKPLQFKLANLI